MTRVHSHTRLRARFCISRSGSGYVATEPYGSESFIRPVVAHSSSFLSSTHIAFNIVRTQCNIASRRRQSREREERRAGPSKGTVFFTFLPFLPFIHVGFHLFHPWRILLWQRYTRLRAACIYIYIFQTFNLWIITLLSSLRVSTRFPPRFEHCLNSVGEIGESNTYL